MLGAPFGYAYWQISAASARDRAAFAHSAQEVAHGKLDVQKGHEQLLQEGRLGRTGS